MQRESNLKKLEELTDFCKAKVTSSTACAFQLLQACN